jgi:hypothetical protein
MALAVFISGSLVSRRIECVSSMHDWELVTSERFAAIFRGADLFGPGRSREQGLSNSDAAGRI